MDTILKPLKRCATSASFADIHLVSIGKPKILELTSSPSWLRAFIAAGESYHIHPIDLVDADGNPGGLPTTRGLIPISHPEFSWQVDCRRRLLTIPMAECALAHWIAHHLDI